MNKIRKTYHKILISIVTNLALYLFIIMSIYLLLPLVFYPNIGLYNVYHIISICVLVIFIFIALIYFQLRFFVRKMYDDFPKEKTSKNHLAVVIVKYKFDRSLFYFPMKFKKFFNILRENHIPFNVYVVNSESEFKSVLKNKNAKVLYIFAHGQKHGVRFASNPDRVFYCKMPKVSHIKYIEQFHCNHLGGETLFEHLGCDGNSTSDKTIYQEINHFIDSKEYVLKLKKLLNVK